MHKAALIVLIVTGVISSLAIYDISQKAIEKSNSIQSLGCTDCFEGPIEDIVNTNTLIIDGRLVKLSLVDTSEEQTGHDDAVSLTKQICTVGENALVELDEWRFHDKKSARVIAQVTCSGKILNEELLVSGHAKIFTDNCDKSRFSKTDWAQSYGC